MGVAFLQLGCHASCMTTTETAAPEFFVCYVRDGRDMMSAAMPRSDADMKAARLAGSDGCRLIRIVENTPAFWGSAPLRTTWKRVAA